MNTNSLPNTIVKFKYASQYYNIASTCYTKLSDEKINCIIPQRIADNLIINRLHDIIDTAGEDVECFVSEIKMYQNEELVYTESGHTYYIK